MLSKMIFASLALCATLALADVPPAPSPQKVELAALTGAQLDPRIQGQYLFDGGLISIGLSSTTGVSIGENLRLEIRLMNDCAPGAACPAEVVEPIIIDLPVVDVRHGQCGERITTALEDDRPADGSLRTVTVTDYRFMLCDLHLNHMTKVVYETTTVDRFSAREITTTSTLYGDALRETTVTEKRPVHVRHN